jgi:glycosyltransferase involved in cell wall biosynthesis
MMRVLHVIPSLRQSSGGPVPALIGFCKAVEGVAEIAIASTNEGLGDEWRRHLEAELPAVTFYWFDQVGAHTTNLSWPMSEWLRKNTTRYDVVHIHALFSPMSTIAAYWSYRQRVPYVIRPLGTLSAYTFRHRNALLKRCYFRLIERHTVDNAAVLHFTAPAEADRACGISHQHPRVVIPIPVALDAMPSVRRFSDRGRPARILFLSRWHPVKGLDLLLPALRLLLQRGDQFRLLLAGGGDARYDQQIRTQIKELGLGEVVDDLGFVQGQRKEQLWREADLVVQPSYLESFGMTVVEAMARGLPVLITDQVDIHPDVQDYQAGVVAQCTVASVAYALASLIANPNLRIALGVNGRRLVQERYAPKQVGYQLMQLYERVSHSHAIASMLGSA